MEIPVILVSLINSSANWRGETKLAGVNGSQLGAIQDGHLKGHPWTHTADLHPGPKVCVPIRVEAIFSIEAGIDDSPIIHSFSWG
jgi:hypothetical protein